MAAPPPALPDLPERYRELSLLGEGGMGTVYRAWDDDLRRIVAVKVIRPDRASAASALPRFLREVRILSTLTHPGVVRVFDSGEWRGTPYFAMEWVDGQTLAEARRTGGLPLRRRIELVMEVADALAAVHARGILHRDLKLQNVMVTREGAAKLMDFGLAKAQSSDTTALTRTGQLVGTLGYLPPEVLRGGAWDERCDVYALGCVAYYLLAGRLPAPGEAVVRYVVHHEGVAVPGPSAVTGEGDGALDAVLLAACALEAEERTPTAAAVRDALRSWLEGRAQAAPASARKAAPASAPARPGSSGTETGPYPNVPPVRRRTVAALGLAAGVLAVAATTLALAAWRRSAPAPVPPPGPTDQSTLADLRARLLDPGAKLADDELARVAGLAGREGILSRLDADPDASPSAAGLFYLAVYAGQRGNGPRAAELLARLVGRSDPRPPRPPDELFALARRAATDSGRFDALEDVLEAALARAVARGDEAGAQAALRRQALDVHLEAWLARDRAVNTAWESWIHTAASDSRKQELRLERAIAAVAPLATTPGADDADLRRYLEALSLTGLAVRRAQFLDACAARFEAPGALPAPPELLRRAAFLLVYAFDTSPATLARARAWLGRALALPSPADLRARLLDLDATLLVRAPTDGGDSRVDSRSVAQALALLDRAAALGPAPATRASLVATRGRVLQLRRSSADGLALMETVPEGDLDDEVRWWFLRSKAELLADSGRQAEGVAMIKESYRVAPPQVRNYLAGLVQMMTLVGYMGPGTPPR